MLVLRLVLKQGLSCAKHSGIPTTIIAKDFNLVVRFFILKKSQISIKYLSEKSGVSLSFLQKVNNANIRSKFYRQFKIQKSLKGDRIISSPLPNLYIFQKWVLENILNEENLVSRYAKAFRKNYSIKQNVKFHRRQRVVLKLDIQDFFGNISNKQLFLVFRNLGYSTDTSSFLANLTSLGKVGIPQGAPTSPTLSNLVLSDFDEWCGELFYNKFSLRYTRYADDITLSGSFEQISPHKAITKIQRKLFALGFSLKMEKIKIQRKGHRQNITGLTVNDVVNVNLKYRKNLRLELHYFLSNSEKHLRQKFPTQRITKELQQYYIDSLLGKINYIIFINPKSKKYFSEQKSLLEAVREELI